MNNSKFHPWIALGLLTALNLLNYVDRSVLNGVQLRIQEEFHLTHEQVGWLAPAFFWSYMIAAPVMGLLADRFPRKIIISVGGIIWSAATLMTAFSSGFASLFARRAILGIGEASFAAIAPTFVVDMFPEERRGRILGLFYFAIPCGMALGNLVAGFVEPRFGWRHAFYVAALPGFVLSLALLLLREPERGQQDSIKEVPSRGTYLGLFTNPAFWTGTLSMAALTFALGAVVWWMPTFLSAERGMSLAMANYYFGIIVVVDGTIAALAGGWLGDWLLRRMHSAYYLVTAVSLLIGAPLMVYAILARGNMMLPAIGVAAFFLLLNTSPLNAAIINSVGGHIRATALAVNIFVIHLLGDASSPALVGRIADHSSLSHGLMVLPVALVVASAFAFLGMRYAPRLRVSADSGPEANPA